MSLRRRITLVSAAAVAIAVVLASAITYVLVSNQLHRQVDSQLQARAARFRLPPLAAVGLEGGGGAATRRREHQELVQLFGARTADELAAQGRTPARPAGAGVAQGATGRAGSNPLSGLNLQPRPNEVRGYQQLIDGSGRVVFSEPTGTRLPVDAATRALAIGGGARRYTDGYVDGTHVRILAQALPHGGAEQFAQPLTSIDNLLATLRVILVVLDVGGIALAALLGGLVARAAVAPVRRLTEATEQVARTHNLSQRVAPSGGDELGRLAVSFNAMLDALESSMTALDASVHAQRQLVADASHELRTPITSVRTNIEILQQAENIDEGSRRRLLDDVVAQIEELTLLVGDLIDLARGEQPRDEFEEVRLDMLVQESVARTRLHAPDVRFDADLEETLVMASPGRLDRAVNNLLDNAVKYSPHSEPIEITLRGGELSVRDHGPGIAPEDLPHLFDRFYRGAEARGRPGSGLGLAIVRQVAESHGGTVTAANAPGGGAILRLTLRPLDDGAPLEESAAFQPSPATV